MLLTMEQKKETKLPELQSQYGRRMDQTLAISFYTIHTLNNAIALRGKIVFVSQLATRLPTNRRYRVVQINSTKLFRRLRRSAFQGSALLAPIREGAAETFLVDLVYFDKR